jgi:hypothetical protein
VKVNLLGQESGDVPLRECPTALRIEGTTIPLSRALVKWRDLAVPPYVKGRSYCVPLGFLREDFTGPLR